MDRGQILDEAKKCVLKDRNATHGEPEDNFNNIAEFWNAWLTIKYLWNHRLDAVDVAVMMDLMKTTRLICSPEVADHWIDKCGYAACGGGIATLQQRVVGPMDVYPSNPCPIGYHWEPVNDERGGWILAKGLT